MSKGTVNKAIIVGRLGADPEVRYAPSGAPVANFSVATNRVWKDRDGNTQESTEWHRIVAWNRLAEVVKEYVKKGHRIYVEGRIQYREWEDQNGQRRFTTEIVASDIQMLEPAPGRGEAAVPPDAAGTSEDDLVPPEGLKDTEEDNVPF